MIGRCKSNITNLGKPTLSASQAQGGEPDLLGGATASSHSRRLDLPLMSGKGRATPANRWQGLRLGRTYSYCGFETRFKTVKAHLEDGSQ